MNSYQIAAFADGADAVRYREIEDEIGRQQSAVKSLQVAQAQFWLGDLR